MTSKTGVKGHIRAKGRVIQHPDNVTRNVATEGPYRMTGPDAIGGYDIYGDNLRGVPGERTEVLVAEVPKESNHVEGEVEANAKLLTAAPALLKELRDFITGVDMEFITSSKPDVLQAVVSRARAAVKQAGDEI